MMGTRRHLGVLAAAMVMVVAAAGCNYDWTQFGYGTGNTRSTPETSLNVVNVGSLTSAWTAGTGAATTSSPAEAQGRVFVGSGNGKLLAFAAHGDTACSGNPKTCQPLWSAQTGGVISSSPAVANGVVYVGSDDGKLYAYDAAGTTNCTGTPTTCDPLWTATTGDGVNSSPAVANGVVYVGSDDGKLYAYGAVGTTNCTGSPTATCDPLWTATTGGKVSTPAVAGGRVFVGSADANLYAFDAAGTQRCIGSPTASCLPLWTGATGGPIATSPAVTGTKVYVSGGTKLYAFDVAGTAGCAGVPTLVCSPLFTGAASSTVTSSPAVAGGRIFLGAANGRLVAFDAAGSQGCAGTPTSCTPLWTASLGGAVTASPAVVGGVVLAASTTGTVAAYSADGDLGCIGTTCQPLWHTTAALGVSSSPIVAQGYVYFGSDDAHLYAFRPTASTTAVPPTVPAPHAAVGDHEVTVRWQRAVRKDLPVTGYVVQPYRDGTPLTPVATGAGDTSLTLTGLDPTAAYSFTVAVSISTGTGQPSPVSNAEVPSTAMAPAAYQIDPSHDGHQVNSTLAATPTKQWSKTFDNTLSYPIVANGRVFVTVGGSAGGGYGARLYALDAATGEQLWGPIELGGTYYVAGLAYGDHKVYAQNYSGVLQAFDEATGASVWSVDLPGQYAFTSPPTAYRGVVYTVGAGSGGTLYARDGQTGAALWTASVSNGDHSSPTVDADGVYVSFACDWTAGFTPATGAYKWYYTTSCSGGGGKTTVLHDGRLYTRDAISGSLVLDAGTGTQVGSHGSVAAPAFDGTTRFEMSGTLTALDATTGETRWSQAGDGTLVTAPIVVDGRVIVGGSSGKLFAFDEATGAQTWTDTASAGLVAPDEQNARNLTGMAAGEGHLYVSAGKTLDAFG